MYAGIKSNPQYKSVTFCWKMSGEFEITIVSSLYQYFPQGRMIIHKLPVLSLIYT